jgi:hypothetical protein
MENTSEFKGRFSTTNMRVRLSVNDDVLSIEIRPAASLDARLSILPITLCLTTLLLTLLALVVKAIFASFASFSISDPSWLLGFLGIGFFVLIISCIMWLVIFVSSLEAQFLIDHESIACRRSVFGIQRLTIQRTRDLQALIYSPGRSSGDVHLANAMWIPARLELLFSGGFRYRLFSAVLLTDKEVMYIAQIISDKLNIPITRNLGDAE